MQSMLIISSIPEDELLLSVKLCSGTDMADTVSVTGFLLELYPKNQPGFTPTTPVKASFLYWLKNQLLTSPQKYSVLVTTFALVPTLSSLELPLCRTQG